MDLDVVVTIENPNDSEASFARARNAGFSRGLVSFAWRPLTATVVRHVAIAAKNQGFTTIAVGSGANLMSLRDSTLSTTDESDLMSLAENMVLLDGCNRLMIWSGSYARKWSEPNLLNQGEDAYFAMVFELHRIIGLLAGVSVTIMVQPCYAHILHDVATCLRLPEEFPVEKVCLALDVACMVAPTTFSRHPLVLPQITAALAPTADIALISDLAIQDAVLCYPLPGKGVLNMRSVLAALDANLPADKPRLLNAHGSPTSAELAAAKAFISEAATAQSAA
jgi:hypothetical protein